MKQSRVVVDAFSKLCVRELEHVFLRPFLASLDLLEDFCDVPYSHDAFPDVSCKFDMLFLHHEAARRFQQGVIESVGISNLYVIQSKVEDIISTAWCSELEPVFQFCEQLEVCRHSEPTATRDFVVQNFTELYPIYLSAITSEGSSYFSDVELLSICKCAHQNVVIVKRHVGSSRDLEYVYSHVADATQPLVVTALQIEPGLLSARTHFERLELVTNTHAVAEMLAEPTPVKRRRQSRPSASSPLGIFHSAEAASPSLEGLATDLDATGSTTEGGLGTKRRIVSGASSVKAAKLEESCTSQPGAAVDQRSSPALPAASSSTDRAHPVQRVPRVYDCCDPGADLHIATTESRSRDGPRVVSVHSRDLFGEERRHEAQALERHRRERGHGERGVVSVHSRDPLGDERRHEAQALERHRRERGAGERGRAVDSRGRDLDRGVGGAFRTGRS